QRSFMSLSSDEKCTHCLSVGTSAGIHYTVDLERAGLFQVWDGGFLDASPMWHDRGIPQTATPLGARILFPVSPLVISGGKAAPLKFREYTLDAEGMPEFTYTSGEMLMRDKLLPSRNERAITRTIAVEHPGTNEFQLAEADVIEKFKDGIFIVN